MKKEYIAPSVEIEVIEAEQMIAASIGMGKEIAADETVTADGRGRDLFIGEEEDLW